MRKLSRIARLVGSTEHIDFQNENKFQGPARAFFEKFDAEINGGGRIDTSALSKLIKEATGDGSPDSGLNVRIVLTTEPFDFAMSSPIVDINNPLSDVMFRREIFLEPVNERIKKLGGMVEGSFDIKKCVVKGFFASKDYTHKLTLSIASSNPDYQELYLTPGEKASIVGHELGHALSYILFISRAVITNTIIQTAVHEMNETRIPKERVAIIAATEEALHIKVDDPEKLAEGSGEAFTAVVVGKAVNMPWEVYGSIPYGFRYAEQVADQLSVRFGGGPELFSALDKMHKACGSYKGKHQGLWAGARYLTLLLLTVATTITAGVPGLILGGFVTLTLIADITLALAVDTNNLGYDRPIRRLERIALEAIAQLKDRRTDPATAKQLANQISQMLDRVKELYAENDESGSHFQRLFDLIIESRKKSVSQVELQKRIENLTNNPLYVRSAQLSTM